MSRILSIPRTSRPPASLFDRRAAAGTRRRASGSGLVRAYAEAAAEVAAETLWPTRCAVCDEPGEPLCERCRMNLPFIDRWRACPRCGAPFGAVQCSECNAVMLARLERSRPPFDACRSAVAFDDASARIVRAYKDAGERRLAQVMAQLMGNAAEPSWLAGMPAVVAIPATDRAVRTRGFDHAALVADSLAQQLDLPRIAPFARPRARDQRALARQARLANMQGRFAVLPRATPPGSVLLVDDVYTTGATLFGAADALRAAGTERIFALTFARVW